MAANVNLLPQELTTSKEVGKFVKTLKTVSISILLITLIIAAGGIASHYYLTQELSKIESEKESLTSTIKSLEATEQSLVLLKDRIQKINQILASRTLEDTYSAQKGIIDSLPEGASLKESEIAGDKSNLDILATRSQGIVELSNNLTSGDYQRVILDSVTFTPLVGYLLSYKF